jgi:hypothetical protein
MRTGNVNVGANAAEAFTPSTSAQAKRTPRSRDLIRAAKDGTFTVELQESA